MELNNLDIFYFRKVRASCLDCRSSSMHADAERRRDSQEPLIWLSLGLSRVPKEQLDQVCYGEFPPPLPPNYCPHPRLTPPHPALPRQPAPPRAALPHPPLPCTCPPVPPPLPPALSLRPRHPADEGSRQKPIISRADKSPLTLCNTAIGNSTAQSLPTLIEATQAQAKP